MYVCGLFSNIMLRTTNFFRVFFVLFFFNVSYAPLLIKTTNIVTTKNYNVSQKYTEIDDNLIYLGNDFNGFKEFLGFKESSGSFKSVNKFGYMGKYQFNLNTLKIYKLKNSKNFINNPELQERVFLINCQRNKWILRKDITLFVGKKINGIEVTESGILAAAHLSGPGNVKKFLRSQGKNDLEDAFGTSISNYLSTFKNYDLSLISAVKRPKI